MFPIADTAGRPIAFSGRILHPDEKSAKYVNSPDTPLFNKSDVLFGIDKAKNFIRKYNFTILVEGQFDVIMMHQAGFRNTVGVSGTALADTLTGAHGVNNLGLVKRLSNNLILAFDADTAGIKAAKRSADIALGLGMDVKVVSIPGVKDPADFIRAEGRAGFEKLLREAVHVIEFSVRKITESAKDTREVGKRIAEEVLPSIAKLQSEIEKSYFIKRTSDMTNIDEAVLWRDLEKINIPDQESLRMSLPGQAGKNVKGDQSRTEIIERKLFGLYYAKNEDETLHEALQKIMGVSTFETQKAHYEPVRQELVFESEIEIGESGEGLAEMLANLEEDYLLAEIEEIKVRLKRAEVEADDDEAEKLSVEYQNLAKRVSEIKNKRYLNKF
jgi:DNA primase